MNKLVCIALAGLGLQALLFAQTKPTRPAATVKVATVNGKPLTIGGIRDMLRNSPASVLQGLKENPKNLFTNYTLTRQLSDQARAAGLDKMFPYRQRLAWDSLGILSNVQLQAMLDSADVPETQIRDAYNKNIQKYRTMMTTVIRVMFEKVGGADKAKAIAEEVVRQARAGVPFPTLGEKYSSEPTLAKAAYANPITPTFDLPTAAKERLFATLPGQVTDPIQLSESYVVFRMESSTARPLSEVRADIKGDLQQEQSDAALAKIKQSIQVKGIMPQFFAANAPNPPPGAPRVEAIEPTAVVAEVNGRKITAKEMSDDLQGMATTARQRASENTAEFLAQYEMLKVLAANALKAGLDKKPPASDQLFWQTDAVLFQATLDEKTKSIISSLQEQQDYYKTNEDKFRLAQTKMIYVSFALSPPPGSPARNETQALQRAMEAKRKFEGGTKIEQLVNEYSEDPDSKSRAGEQDMRLAEPSVPKEIKDAVFAGKVGQMVGPVRLPQGFFLFLIKENKVAPFEEVRNDIYNVLSDGKFKTWFDGERGKINVTIDDEAALKAELAYHQ